MSTPDLELLKDLPKLRVPSAADVRINPDTGSCTSWAPYVAAGGEKDDDVVTTPKSEEHMIPAVLSCPPAPRKPKRKASCRRKLLDLEFFEIVNREEVDSFFRSSFEDVLSKRRCPCK